MISCQNKKEESANFETVYNLSDSLIIPQDTVILADDDSIDSDAKQEDIGEVEKDHIVFKSFTNLPEEIEGCGSYFSLNKKENNAGKFIYVDNMENGYMSVNGNLEKFKVGKSTENSTKFSNEKFHGILKFKKIESMDEGGLYKGTLKITNQEGHEKKINIYGGIGC